MLKKPVAMQSVNMKTILNDKSECKKSTHFKIKSGLIDHGKALFGNFTKKDMLILCKAYDIQISTSSSNDVIKDKLCSVIESSDGILFPKYLEETFSSSESNLSSKSLETSVPTPSTFTGNEATFQSQSQLKKENANLN